MSNNALLNKCCCFEYIKEKEKETPTKKKKYRHEYDKDTWDKTTHKNISKFCLSCNPFFQFDSCPTLAYMFRCARNRSKKRVKNIKYRRNVQLQTDVRTSTYTERMYVPRPRGLLSELFVFRRSRQYRYPRAAVLWCCPRRTWENGSTSARLNGTIFLDSLCYQLRTISIYIWSRVLSPGIR